MSYLYPTADSFVDRISYDYCGNVTDYLLEIMHRDKWTWDELSKLTYSYAFYYPDLVEAINEYGEDGVLEELSPDYVAKHAKRHYDTLRDLFECIGGSPKDTMDFGTDVDTIVFTSIKLDPLVVKLTCNVNVVDFSDKFSIYEYARNFDE